MTAKKQVEAKSDAPTVDQKGYVTVSNGDTVAKILPQSVRVWEARGWKVVDPDETTPVEADPFAPTEDVESQEG